MSRLTRKDGYDYYAIHRDYGFHFKEMRKLGQLEDIEEELGIDLVMLFKALKDGIYINEYNHGLMYGLIVPHLVHECGQYYFKHYGDFGSEEFSFDEYGETWALTKEELK